MTENITDKNGVVAKPGMRARHWGSDERVFLGTIGEEVVTLDGKEIMRSLVFIYDEKPEVQEDREYVPLYVVDPFELLGAEA